MLGFLKPRGELVEISGRTVVFLSAKPYKTDQRFEVRLGLPDAPSRSITVAVRVVSCRPTTGDAFVVAGTSEDRRDLPNLVGYPLRNYPRAPHRITVTSEGLPNYRAVTRDLGRGGFGAEIDGELQTGKLLSVRLEFDEPLGWTLDLKAKVAWTAWKTQNRYDTGFAFIEDPLYALPLEQLGAWCEHRAQHELIPFKPPDKVPPRPLKALPNQLPQQPLSAQPAQGVPDQFSLGDAQRAASGSLGFDDDPTPLGLPTLVQPPPRPTSFKLPTPETSVSLERPSSFKLQSAVSLETVPSSEDEPLETEPGSASLEEDPGVRVHFAARLRGWAWEGADDAVVVVLEDINGGDHWVEFPGCRGLQARCRHRDICLLGMAVTTKSAMIDELSRYSEDVPLSHFRFYDDHQRVVLDIVATECREQIR